MNIENYREELITAIFESVSYGPTIKGKVKSPNRAKSTEELNRQLIGDKYAARKNSAKTGKPLPAWVNAPSPYKTDEELQYREELIEGITSVLSPSAWARGTGATVGFLAGRPKGPSIIGATGSYVKNKARSQAAAMGRAYRQGRYAGRRVTTNLSQAGRSDLLNRNDNRNMVRASMIASRAQSQEDKEKARRRAVLERPHWSDSKYDQEN